MVGLMSGTILTQSAEYWSAASWLFNYVLEALRDLIGPGKAYDRMDEALSEHLGWFSIQDLNEEDQAALQLIVCSRLMDRMREVLPDELEERPKVIQHVQAFVDLVCLGKKIPPRFPGNLERMRRAQETGYDELTGIRRPPPRVSPEDE